MSEALAATDLVRLVSRVFEPTTTDKGLAILLDLPDERLADNPDWAARRATVDCAPCCQAASAIHGSLL